MLRNNPKEANKFITEYYFPIKEAAMKISYRKKSLYKSIKRAWNASMIVVTNQRLQIIHL